MLMHKGKLMMIIYLGFAFPVECIAMARVKEFSCCRRPEEIEEDERSFERSVDYIERQRDPSHIARVQEQLSKMQNNEGAHRVNENEDNTEDAPECAICLDSIRTKDPNCYLRRPIKIDAKRHTMPWQTYISSRVYLRYSKKE